MIFGPFIVSYREARKFWNLHEEEKLLKSIAETEVFAALPQAYRDAATVKLRVAEIRTRPGIPKEEADREIFREIEDFRKSGVKKMMEQASQRHATEDQVIRIMHAFDESARAHEESIAQVAEQVNQSDARIEGVAAGLHETSAQMAEAFSRIGQNLAAVDRDAKSAAGDISRQLRKCVIAIGGLAVVEAAHIIFSLVAH